MLLARDDRSMAGVNDTGSVMVKVFVLMPGRPGIKVITKLNVAHRAPQIEHQASNWCVSVTLYSKPLTAWTRCNRHISRYRRSIVIS